MADPSDETTAKPSTDDSAAAAPDGQTAPSGVSTATPEVSPSAGNDSAADKDQLNTDDIEQLLDQASDSLEQAAGSDVSTQAETKPFALGDLQLDADGDERQPIDLLGEVEMDLRIELGRTQMRLEEVLQLRGGSVVALDKLAGDPVDIYVNGRLIARGEVLVMNDNFCIRVTELVGA